MGTTDDSQPVPVALDLPPRWFRDALDAMLDGVFVMRAVRDADGRTVDFDVLFANEATHDVAGRSAAEVTGSRMTELYPSIDELLAQYARVADTGEPLVLDEVPYHDVIDGRAVSAYYAIQVVRVADGVVMTFRDVSEQVRGRHEMAATNRRFEAAQALAHIGIFTIDNATDTVWFSDELRRIAGVPADEPLGSRDALIRAGFDVNDRDALDAAQRHIEEVGAITVEATFHRRDGEVRNVLLHADRDERDGELVGVWGTVQDVTDRRNAQRDLDEAHGQLLDQRALIDQFQMATLAPVPPDLGVDVEASYFAATGEQRFGGDWYDVFRLDSHRVAVAVGDVAGHGIDAVAAMATLRNALRAYGYAVESPGAALAALNEFVVRSHLDGLATALFGVYDERTRLLRWAHAGHPPPLLATADGAVLFELAGGPPIGAGHRPGPWEEHVLELPPGALLLLYTDGLIERRGEHIDVGLARLKSAAGDLQRRGGPVARRLRDQLATGHADDICILALRVPGGV